MASFPAKKGWNRPGKSENKKLSFRYVLTQRVIENSKKIAKKFKKLKNTTWLHFRSKQEGKHRETGNIKIIAPFRSYPTRIRKYQKNGQKNSKNTIMASFQAKIGWKMPRKRKNKNYRSVPFLRDL